MILLFQPQKVEGQTQLGLVESPASSGYFSTDVQDSLAATGSANGKTWLFEAEGGDRVTVWVVTDATDSYPRLRLRNASNTVLASHDGTQQGESWVQNYTITTPGTYNLFVYSDHKATALRMRVEFGRGFLLESESNDSAYAASALTVNPTGGGFTARAAGALRHEPDYYDLGTLGTGNAINISLGLPTSSTLVSGDAEMTVFKKGSEATPLSTTTASTLNATVVDAGEYYLRVRGNEALSGRALRFDGSDDGVSLGNPAALQITGDQTIEMWIRPVDFSGLRNPWNKAYAGEGTMTIETGGDINYFYGTGGGDNSPYQTFNSLKALRPGQWQHIALVRQLGAEPRKLSWYINGRLVNEAAASYFPAVAGALNALVGHGYAGRFKGEIDEVRLWNVARTGAEIASNLDNVLTGGESGLVGYYKFAEGGGTTLEDSTANALDGSIEGSPEWAGNEGVGAFSAARLGLLAKYVATVAVTDATPPTVTGVTPTSVYGPTFEGIPGLLANPGNMTAYRGQNGTSFNVQVTAGGGTIWGTDTYTDDSPVAVAALHSGLLADGETGIVTVTILAGQEDYLGTSRNGVNSNSYGSFPGSYSIAPYTGASPTLNGLYTSLRVGFSERMLATTLQNPANVELRHAGSDGVFGNGNDYIHTLTTSYAGSNQTAYFSITDGPLQPGLHRLRVTTGAQDRSGNAMAGISDTTFTVLSQGNFVAETRDNDTRSDAGSISLTPGTAFDRSFFYAHDSAVGANPHRLKLLDVTGDGRLDAVVAAYYTNELRVFAGNADGSFAATSANYATGSNPYDLELIDFDTDGDLDVVAVCYGSDQIRLHRNNGAGALEAAGSVTVGDGPLHLVKGHFNADMRLDLAVANYESGAGGRSLSILLSNVSGGFDESKVTVAGNVFRPYGLAAGDVNNDGKADLVAGDYDTDDMRVFLGVGDGTFGIPTSFDVEDLDPTSVALADFDHDGKLDALVATDYHDYLSILKGNGDGTFQPFVRWSMDGFANQYFVEAVDVDGDTWVDLVIPRTNGLVIRYNRQSAAAPSFTAPIRYDIGYTLGAAVADLNGDTRPDIVVNEWNSSRLRTLLGNAQKPLAVDATMGRLRHGYGRGQIGSDTDEDWFSFTVDDAKRMVVAVENPGTFGSAGLYFSLFNAVGTNISNFYSDANGRGQSDQITLDAPGTYYVRVMQNYGYRGEYQFRVSLFDAPTVIESEGNDSIGAADVTSLTLSVGSLTGASAGYISESDTNGDYWSLGNLGAGANITLDLKIPATSSLSARMAIFKSDGTQMAISNAGDPQLTFAVTAGNESAYYFRVYDGTSTRGLHAEYLVDITIADPVAPTITLLNLPAEGGSVTYVSPNFSINYSEDMLASTVTNPASYELRHAGPNTTFDNADDVLYTVTPQAYTSGLTASYHLPDGPLQPGNYRFTAKTALTDKFANPLAVPYVRLFSVAAVPGFVLEDRSNNDAATADSISLSPTTAFDGSFTFLGSTDGGTNLWGLKLLDLNGDGNKEAIAAKHNTSQLAVFPGNADGTFGAAVNYATGTNPWDIELLDIDNDGDLDVAVSCYGSDEVRLFSNPGNGTLVAGAVISVGDGPIHMVKGRLNNDAFPDLAVANHNTGAGGRSISVLLGNGAGGFTESKITVGGQTVQFYALAVGNFDEDANNLDDLAAGDYASDDMAVFLNTGGTFAAPAFFPVEDTEPTGAGVADFDHDGNLDLAVCTDYHDYISILRGNGDGTFQPFTRLWVNGGNSMYFVETPDLNADGWADLVVSRYGGSGITVLYNRGTGTVNFSDPIRHTEVSQGAGVAWDDVNHDGRIDLVANSYDQGRIYVWTGNSSLPLAADGGIPGMRQSAFRGFLTTDSDEDWFTFTAQDQDRLLLTTESPGAGAGSTRSFNLYDSRGQHVGGFTPDYYGYGQWSATLNRPGRYYVRVSVYYGGVSEYRARVTLARPPTFVEQEDNDSLSQTNSPPLTLSSGQLTATVLGVNHINDSAGDYFSLGNLSPGTQVTLTVTPTQLAVDGIAARQALQLQHRWSFGESGGATQFTDTVSGLASAELRGAGASVGGGQVILPGGSQVTAAYIDLPNGIASSRTSSATFEGWAAINGSQSWSRLFDFGTGTSGEITGPGGSQSGTDYLLLTAQYGGTLTNNRVEFRMDGSSQYADPVVPYNEGQMFHFAVTYDANGSAPMMRYFRNGILMANVPVSKKLTDLDDVNNWLGRGQWTDPCLNGAYSEFRVWDGAFSDVQALASAAAGPDALPAAVSPALAALPHLTLFKSDGTQMAQAAPGSGPLSFTLAAEDAAAYVFRVHNNLASATAQYQVSVSIADVTPPVITSNTLPAQGSTVTFPLPDFSLGFNEDMLATTVRNVANYELRSAGEDGIFGNGNDVLYTLSHGNYTSGLSHSVHIVNGPLQPGAYRFTASTGLQDLFLQPMTAAHVREFTVVGVPGFVTEDRDNGSLATADILSGAGMAGAAFDGSYAVQPAMATGGNAPIGVLLIDLNDDDNLDMVVSNRDSDSVTTRLNNGAGGFGPVVSYPVGDGPHYISKFDMDKDGDEDVVVPNAYTDNVTVLRNNADGTLTALAPLPGGDHPLSSATGDFNGDDNPDFVVTNHLTGANGRCLSVYLGDGLGGFVHSFVGAGLTPSWRTYHVTVADFDGNNLDDIAAVNYDGEDVLIFLSTGAGNFAAPVRYDTDRVNPTGIAVTDFNGDFKADLVVCYDYYDRVNILSGNGDGTFQPYVNWYLDGYRNQNNMRVADLNADGYPDMLAPRWGMMVARQNKATPALSFNSPTVWSEPYLAIDAAVSDLNGDGRRDMVVLSHDQSQAWVYLGQGTFFLNPDSGIAGMRNGYGRGQLDVNGEYDHFSFSLRGGERLVVAAESPGAPGSSGFAYDLFNYRGDHVLGASHIYHNGYALTQPYTVPYDGRFYLRVGPYYWSTAEYRFRVSVVDAQTQIEAEDNNSTGQATAVAFTAGSGTRTAKIFGHTAGNDSSGDYWRLGNLSSGTQINVSLNRPGGSTFITGVLQILRPDGGEVAASTPGGTSVSHSVSAGEDGVYYVRVTESAENRTLLATYQLNLSLTDVLPPQVTGIDLPDEGTSTLDFIDGFSLNFNEDLLSSSVNSAANYVLKEAGADLVIGSSDDVTFAVSPVAYSAGLSSSFGIPNGPLPPGSYRLTVAGLKDTYGTSMSAPFVRNFSVAQVPGITTALPGNNTPATATPLLQVENPAGLVTAAGRGRRTSSGDTDYWSFNGTSGQRLTFDVELVGASAGTHQYWRIRRPNGTVIWEGNLGNNSQGGFIPLTLDDTGVFQIQVNEYNAWTSEYRFRVSLINPAILQLETEANNNIASADAVTLTTEGGIASAKVAGLVHNTADLDYFNLGVIPAGKTVFLSAALPPTSSFLPVVALYNSAGVFMSEFNGSTGDGSAEVRINSPDTYFLLVRSTGLTGSYMSQYVTEVQVHETSSVTIPNLQVTAVPMPPESGLQSGSAYTYSFTVTNVGSADIAAQPWSDRLVLSQNQVYGDGDDIEVGVFPRNAALASGAFYTVSGPSSLPQGLVGNYYLIARTDIADQVDELVLENDNTTPTSATFPVTLAPYPNIVVQGLGVTGPVANVFTFNWTLANTGDANAPDGFKERVRVINTTTGATLLDELRTPGVINAAANLARTAQVTTSAAGTYLVTIIGDANNDLFEHDGTSHATAEVNTTTTSFNILQYWTIAASTPEPAKGSVSGGGSFLEGAQVTLTATPNTATLPYQFVRWTSGGNFVSANATYVFTANANRNLVAEFTLATYQVAATVSPAGAGTVSGGGFYQHGSTATLTATAGPGYLFARWEELASNIGGSATLNLTVTGPRNVQAIFNEANPTHVVTTATNPAALGVTTGGGTFNNGQTANFAAPESVIQGDAEYLFSEWKLNGVFFGTQRVFSKTFSTLDNANMAFVAHYTSRSLKPTVTGVTVNYTNPVRAANDVRFTLTFDRPMNTAINPVLALSSANAPTAATMPPGGTWQTSTQFQSAAVTFTTGNGGAYVLNASIAADTNGRVMAAADVHSFDVDVAPPLAPLLALTSSTGNSATVNWNGYAAPGDINGFRLYLQTTDYTNISTPTALLSVGGTSGGVRSFTFNGLQPDTNYFAAVVAVDLAGNANPEVMTLPIFLDSTVPPPVAATLTRPTPNTARVNWAGYNSSSLIGFQGFRVYREETPFTDVTGLTHVAQLAANVTQHELTPLDRTKTYHIAIVGYNRLNEFNPAVTPLVWTDPLAGDITADLTIGTAGADTTVNVLQSMTVKPGATLTLLPGTTIKFAAATGLTIEGTLLAEGTPLRPINLTSALDVPGGSPARGNWNGVTLSGVTNATRLGHLWVRYGQGVVVAGGTPVIGSLFAVWNQNQGLRASGAANINVANSFFALNDLGVSAADSAQVVVSQSVLKTNTNFEAAQTGGSTLNLGSNWWGTTNAGEISALVQGSVGTGSPLATEPVLAAGFAATGGISITGSSSFPVTLASANATAFRLSENSLFPGVLWTDIFPVGEVNTFSPYPFTATHTLSPGGGLKTVYAQFRSITGQTSAAIPVNVTLITDGPTINTFNLVDGQTLTRPVAVNGAASAPLGMQNIQFFVDDVLLSSAVGGTLNFQWDIRTLNPGPYRAKLLARDNAGNVSTREVNVNVAPTAPPAPVITVPANNSILAVTPTSVTGTAEPGVTVQLRRNGNSQGTTTATGGGTFSFANVPLLEGVNELIAIASDSIGTRSSTAVNVTLDSGPPAAVIVDEPPVYDSFLGLQITWHFADTGERPVKYRVFWHNSAFTTTSQASGQSILLAGQNYTLSTAPDGPLFIRVVGYDDAGNASALSNTVAYTLDRTAPVFTVAYDKSMPAGPGTMEIVLTANEPLASTPLMTIRPNGLSTPFSVPLSQVSGSTYTASYNVTNLSARTGTAVVNVTGTDLTGNTFAGSPGGTALSFDVTPPTATLAFDRALPIKTVSEADPNVAVDVNLSFTLTLSEVPKPGTTPSLVFTPPIGADVIPTLSGSGLNWTGSILLTSAMGRGMGQFVFSSRDGRDNLGSTVTPNQIEIYNTEHPDAPGIPVNLRATTLAGGDIKIEWNAVADAQSYRIYREPGNTGVTPTVQVASSIVGTQWTDEDVPADGIYRYAIRAFRVSIAGAVSGTLNALSDRLAPDAPLNPVVILTNSGVQITWSSPSTGPVPHRYHVYRNGTKIRTVTTPQPVLDFPPRGLHQYEIASADNYDNESRTAPIPFEFFVDAVTALKATVREGHPTGLQWQFSDPVGVGYNVYRNGVKQNGQMIPVGTKSFTDNLPLPPNESVEYRVTALDNQSREGAPRSVLVQPVAWSFLLNLDAQGNANRSQTRYFDNYSFNIVNHDASNWLAIGAIQVNRTLSGGTTTALSYQTTLNIAAGDEGQVDVPVPGAQYPGQSQTAEIAVVTAPNEGGATVSYIRSGGLNSAVEPALMLEMRLTDTPVAGGLTDVKVRIHNRGYTPADIILGRQAGQHPGDLVVQVRNQNGVEVSRKTFNGVNSPAIPGLIIRPNGDSVVTLAVGASVEVAVDDVLVPIALAEGGVARFYAEISEIRTGLGTPNERVSGPLTGTLNSNVIQTPYYGTVTTAQTTYSGDQVITITGQSIDRGSSSPQGNLTMKIGFSARGAVWYQDITSDANGNFSYNYTPFAGFAGELTIWAAHPDVFDVLAQRTIRIYRLYVTPSFGDIRMSKNDHLDFTVGLINPADLPLTGLEITFSAYRLDTDGITHIPVPEITCDFQDGNGPGGIPALGRVNANIRLTATAAAPDSAIAEIVFVTAQGASVKFTGDLELLQPVPILSMTSPAQGFVDVTVNRGQIVSREITLKNLGTRALEDVELVPPSTIPWMQLNLVPGVDGNVDLPDIPVGGTTTFTIAFVPPPATALGYFQDKVKIRGSNAVAGFEFNLFALVSSNATGNASFHVGNFLDQDVPAASVRMKNTITGNEIGPFNTNASGDVSFNGLTEGTWAWQVIASGHSTAAGTVDIVADQTAPVDVVLNRSLVTVTFQVKPVPFTDRYDIVIEQTFLTFVPAPVLVMTPPKYDFGNVQPGFETTVIYELKNHGLIKTFDVNVSGTREGIFTVEPLIDFIPELLPQQVVQIPTRIRLAENIYAGEAGGCGDGTLGGFTPPLDPSAPGTFGGPAPTLGGAAQLALGDKACPSPSNLADFLNGLAAIASIGANGCFQSQQSGHLGEVLAVALAAAVVYQTVTTLPAAEAPILSTIVGLAADLLQCIGGHFSAGGGGGSSGGGGGGNGGGYGSGGNGCFTGNTLVMLSNGNKVAISQLRQGDVLKTGTDYRETAEIREVYELQSTDVRSLRLRNGSDTSELRVTGEHMVWKDGTGWTAARDLMPGDWLHSQKGEMIEIVSTQPLPGRHPVFTVQLKGNNTFYAGGVLVQDLCGGRYLDAVAVRNLKPVGK